MSDLRNQVVTVLAGAFPRHKHRTVGEVADALMPLFNQAVADALEEQAVDHVLSHEAARTERAQAIAEARDEALEEAAQAVVDHGEGPGRFGDPALSFHVAASVVRMLKGRAS